MKVILVIFFSLHLCILIGQDKDRKIEFPDVDGYVTLKTDFHIHTVFSDGSVWPDIRIQDAVKDGLDAISLTEHLEYQPHKKDLPHPDRNRSFELATEMAKPHDLLIIHGAEITRDMPPGHANALFITDANKLIIDDPEDAYREANRQGAFVFWNHPDWIRQQDDGVAKMTDMHRILVDEKLLHGIEVVNDLTYSEEALELAKKENLVAIGTSDIHGLVDYQYRLAEGGHRPICLVFAKERSIESIKEALFAGRTVAWYDNLLVGKEQWLNTLIEASLDFKYDGYIGPTSVLKATITNNSDVHFILQNKTEFSFQENTDIIEVKPHSTEEILIRTLKNLESVELEFDVLNASMGKKSHPKLKVTLTN